MNQRFNSARHGLGIVLGTFLLLLLAGPIVAQTNCVLNAVSGYVVVPSSPTLDLPPLFTIEAWVRPASTARAYMSLVDKNYSTSFGFGTSSLYPMTDSVELRLSLAPTNFYGPRIRSDSLTWTHVAVTVDTVAKEIVFYVNGLLAMTQSGDAVRFANTVSDMRIGTSFAGDRFSGAIDEVRLWSLVRSAHDIASLWDHEARGNEAGLVALYHFEDARDSVAWNRASTGGLKGGFSSLGLIAEVPWDFAFTDEHEPNGSYANATPMAYGSSFATAAIAPGDTDVYKIYTRAGDILRVQTKPKNPGDVLSLRVSVYSPDSILHITTYVTNFPDFYSAASVDGYRFVRVRGNGAVSGAYVIKLIRGGGLKADSTEPNNSLATATPRPWGTFFKGTIFPGIDGGIAVPDTDYYSVTATAGEIGLFPYSYQGFSCGSGYVSVHSPSGQTLATSLPGSVNNNVLFATSGTYYVRVRANEAAYQYVLGFYKGLADIHGMLFDPLSYGGSLYLLNGWSDAYDGAYILKINGAEFQAGTGFSDTELGGRQFVYGPATMSGLTVSRRFFVPTTAQGDTLGFLRIQEVLTNATGAPITVRVAVSSNFGSGTLTRTLATSSGDTVVSIADRWITTDDQNTPGGDPVITNIFDGDGGADRVDSVKLVNDDLYWEWRNVTVPAGETRIYMYYVAQDTVPTNALRKGPAFSAVALPAAAKLGLGADATKVMNWPTAALVSVDQEPPVPFASALRQNYPNPFNPKTTIEFTVAGVRGQGLGASEVRLVVYDLLGREVAVLVNEKKEAGRYEVTWNAAGMASGVYICRMKAGEYIASGKMLLVK